MNYLRKLRAIPKTFLFKTALALGMMAVVLVPSLPVQLVTSHLEALALNIQEHTRS